MQLKALMLVAALGLTGCTSAISEPGICAGLRGHVNALETALLAHPETPDAVGEAGADTVIGFAAGCRS